MHYEMSLTKLIMQPLRQVSPRRRVDFPSGQDIWIPLPHLVNDVVHELELVFDIGDFDFWKADASRIQSLVLEGDHAHMVAFLALIVWQIDLLVLQAVEDGRNGVLFGIGKKAQSGCR